MDNRNLYELKTRLFDSVNAAIPGHKDMKESEFLEYIFPQQLLRASVMLEKRTIDLPAIFFTRSRQTKLMNGVHSGSMLSDLSTALLDLFRADLSYWKAVRTRCRELAESSRPDLLQKILTDFANELESILLWNAVQIALSKDLGYGFAMVLLCLLLDYKESLLWTLFHEPGFPLFRYDFLEYDSGREDPSALPDVSMPIPKSISKEDMFIRMLTPQIRLERMSEGVRKDLPPDQSFELLYRAISEDSIATKKLLQITGPVGSDGSLLIRCLYRKLADDVKAGQVVAVAPFFVDLDNYRFESAPEAAPRRLCQELRPYLSYCSAQRYRIPILFIDHLRSYQTRSIELDNYLGYLLEMNLPDVRLVVSAEHSPICSPAHRRSLPSYAGGEYLYHASVAPLSLMQGRHSPSAPALLTGGPGRSSALVNLCGALSKTGVRQLGLLPLLQLEPYAEASSSPSALYERFCLEQLGGSEAELMEAAKWTFSFVFGPKKLPKPTKRIRSLLFTHEQVLDYLTARYYLHLLSNRTQDDVLFLRDKPLAPEITRIVSAMLSSSAATEALVLELVQTKFGDMNRSAKSEMVLWLNALQQKQNTEKADRFLSVLYLRQKKIAEAATDYASLDDRDDHILYRTLCIYQIGKGNSAVADNYIELLLNNRLANEVNRGWFLENCRDKLQCVAADPLRFIDTIHCGKNSLSRLESDRESCIAAQRSDPYFEYNLLTSFSLLDARVCRPEVRLDFELRPFINAAVNHLSWYDAKDQNFRHKTHYRYFIAVKERLLAFVSRKSDEPPRKYSAFLDQTGYEGYCRRLLSTGWIVPEIPSPGDESDRMFRTLRLAMQFLPEEGKGRSCAGYSKTSVLNLIMVYNRDTPKRIKTPTDYARLSESRNGRRILYLDGRTGKPAYQQLARPAASGKKQTDVNSLVADDMEQLQIMYDLFRSRTKHPAEPNAPEPESFYHLQKVRSGLKSSIGRQVFRLLFPEKEAFAR